MFSRFAENIGLYDYIAPPKSESQIRQEKQDEEYAKQLEQQEKQRLQQIHTQYQMEKTTEKRGEQFFAKKQRVSYFHKMTGETFDAVVLGVHYDDGPDQPYYTIKYRKVEKSTEDENNNNSGNNNDDHDSNSLDANGSDTRIQEIEKQTNPDRLKRAPWDEEKTWEVLRGGKGW